MVDVMTVLDGYRAIYRQYKELRHLKGRQILVGLVASCGGDKVKAAKIIDVLVTDTAIAEKLKMALNGRDRFEELVMTESHLPPDQRSQEYQAMYAAIESRREKYRKQHPSEISPKKAGAERPGV